MNERIIELAEQAGFENGHQDRYGNSLSQELEQFAKLIVQECIKEITDQMFYEGIDESNNPGYYKAINRVEEHFGVEE